MQKFSLNTQLGRREFLKRSGITLTAATLAGTLTEILASCASSTSPETTHGTATIDVSSLTADGQYLVDSSVKPEGGKPMLIIRQTATAYTALSTQCTHEDCQVNNPSGGTIFCSCHSSRFDLHGGVINGPASRPLSSYTTTFDATAKKITVTY
jgi:thiosulfate dehydrogenase [quinone] large subunit